jgi:nucleotide-binding universal stress UspA family protein
MGYRTILVYLHSAESAQAILDVAVPLAKQQGAHLVGLNVRAQLPLYVTATTALPEEVVEQERLRVDEYAGQIKRHFDRVTAGMRDSCEWRSPLSLDARISNTVAEQALSADLVVVSKITASEFAGWPGLPADLALDAGRPTLIVPATDASFDIGGHVLVAWNATRECARAMFDALPVLRSATTVTILTIDPGSSKVEPGSEEAVYDLMATLKRHRVNAVFKTTQDGDMSPGDALIRYASDHRASLIVMGCYGHSRMRETVFGGTSQQLIDQTTIPLLMSH